MVDLDPLHVAWCRNHFRIMMTEGGTWGVPRSGLMFRRQGNRLELIARMPHHPDMPCSPAQLHEQQQSEFDNTKLHFEAAGVNVVDRTASHG